MAIAASARGQIQHAVAAEGHARAARGLGAGDEHVGRVAQRAPVPAAARDRDRGIFRADRLAVGEIHVAVGRKLRMQRDVHEPSQSLGAHLRHALDGLCLELAGADHAQRSGPLRDEDGVVRDERETPRPREPARDDRDLDVLAFGRLVAHGLPRAAAAR